MALTPLCQVKDGAGPFVGTNNGVDVTPGNTISIQLLNPVGVVDWFLQIVGTDELTAIPVLTGVNPFTHQVTSPATVVTFTFPGALGRAIGFKSTVTGVGGPIDTNFGVYSLTTFSTRVGFVTETREGNSSFGWATKINPLIRTGGGGGGGGDPHYTLTTVIDDQTIPVRESMLHEDHVVIEDGGNLIVEGDVSSIRTEDNFSVLYVPTRAERVVQQNDELLFTDDMTIDGQLTVDGQITDATPYDGYDVLAALTSVAPGTPAILGAASPVSFLSPAQARTVMSVPSVAEMNAAIGSAGLQIDPTVHHSSFTAQLNRAHYFWSIDGTPKTITLPTNPVDGDRIELLSLGNGTDLVTIDNGPIGVTYNASANSGPGFPFTFSSGGFRVLLVFKPASQTTDTDLWCNTSDSVTSQFGGYLSPVDNGVIVSGGANPGQVYAHQLSNNSVLGRADNDIISFNLLSGHLLFRSGQTGLMGSYSPSYLNPWTTTLSSPGSFVLEVDRINRYVATAGLILQFPSALDGYELEIKECSSSAGTAPDSVTVDTTSPFIFVENIGVGGNTQTDTLTEYKTWIKYKFDASQNVWRIVGAAYQLP